MDSLRFFHCDFGMTLMIQMSRSVSSALYRDTETYQETAIPTISPTRPPPTAHQKQDRPSHRHGLVGVSGVVGLVIGRFDA